VIDPKDLFFEFQKNNVTKFSGVPDSLLKNFCAYVSKNADTKNHLITANEGSAIAYASGQYISSGEVSCVYMQNSGFGNSINPILSLASDKVYGIPMVIMVGWRGEPGIKDEPQHIKQGSVMENLLKACDIPYFILDANEKNLTSFMFNIVNTTIKNNSPVVLLVRKNTFKKYELSFPSAKYILSREESINAIIESSDDNDIFISTTGMASRELFENRLKDSGEHSRDFLTVGSMGHANMIAYGIAERKKNLKIFCIDGDGASIMHLGNMTSIGQSNLNNFIHIILNNEAHDSVGGQPTCGDKIDFLSIAKSSGYLNCMSASTDKVIKLSIAKLKESKGPNLLEIKVNRGSRSDLGRPTKTPQENKEALMTFLEKN